MPVYLQADTGGGMSSVIIPYSEQAFRSAVRHPGRRMPDDEMFEKGLVDIKDPNAIMPAVCSYCRQPASKDNPMRLDALDRDPRKLAKSYLYRSQCARCAHKNRSR